MKKSFFLLIFCLSCFAVSVSAQQQDSINESIDEIESSPPEATTYIPTVNLTGNFNDLVIVVGFPDRNNDYPTLNSNSFYPLYGQFQNGTLLRDYVDQNGSSIPADEWYEPFFDYYFNTLSGGVYNVDFDFVKSTLNNGVYVTNTSMADWITLNGSSTSVVYNRRSGILGEIADDVFNDDNNVFDNVSCIHFVFVGLINNSEFYVVGGQPAGGTILDNFNLTSSDGSTTYWSGPVSLQTGLGPIPHERLHIIGTISGSPDNFRGLPDRGLRTGPGDGHQNSTGVYDVMYHTGDGFPGLHSLYGYTPLMSHDLIFLGWIQPDEIEVINETNYTNYSQLKLADINYPLTTQQKNDGFRRIIKVMINENYQGDRDEYFLIEYHNASEFDKAFENYDEYQTGGYNTGVLIWHIKEVRDMINTTLDNLIDLKTAVPYNGWYGNPVPDDEYPRDYTRDADWNGIHSGEYDYLDDLLRDNNYDPVLGRNIWQYSFLPDGGRHIWETTVDHSVNDYGWEPTHTWFFRLQSMKSDFFSDDVVKGYVADKISDATRPSTRTWGGLYGPPPSLPSEQTHIAITDIKRESGYMSLKVNYNYWEGEILENSTMSGNVTIGQNVIVPAGLTLTINPGTNVTSINGSSIIVNGTLNIEGTSSENVVLDFVAPSTSPINCIWAYAGSEVNIDYTEIKNAALAIWASDAEVHIDHSNLHDMLINIYFYNTLSNYYGSTIKNTYINTSASDGVWLRYSSPLVENNKVTDISDIGVRILDSSAPTLLNNSIENCNEGTTVSVNSVPTFRNNELINVNYGFDVRFTSVALANPGLNTIQANSYNIYTLYNSQVYAQNNYWSEDPPNINKFYADGTSSFDYSSWLSSDPGSGSTLPKTGKQPDLIFAFSELAEGRYDNAERLFKKVINEKFNEKESNYALNGLSVCYSKSKKEGFKKYLEDELKPKLGDAKSDLYRLYLELHTNSLIQGGKYNEALVNLKIISDNYMLDSELRKELNFREGVINLVFKNNEEKAKSIFEKIKNDYRDERTKFEIDILLAAYNNGGFSLFKNRNFKDNLEQKTGENKELPSEYELHQNYPNPFNPSTTIKYSIPVKSLVKISIYDITGSLMKSFNLNSQTAGSHNVEWDGTNEKGIKISSGVYIYRLEAISLEGSSQRFTQSKKMILLR